MFAEKVYIIFTSFILLNLAIPRYFLLRGEFDPAPFDAQKVRETKETAAKIETFAAVCMVRVARLELTTP